MPKEFPPPIYSNQPGTWANSTVVKRWPDTAQKVLEDNDYSSQIKENLLELINDIPHQPIRQLKDHHAPDWDDWSSYIGPRDGKDWLEVPWFFGEHYFYRRIIEAVDYFNTSLDPFGKEKRLGLEKTVQDIQSIALYLDGFQKDQDVEILRGVLYSSLWGNQADLSLWPAGSSANPDQNSQDSLRAYLLVDDTKQVIRTFQKMKPAESRLDIFVDNAGFEFVTDLGLVDTFLRYGFGSEVVLHVKAHPTFVSDVIEADLLQTIEFLTSSEVKEIQSLGNRLDSYLQGGKLSLHSHFFWNSPLAMWDFPDDLLEDLGRADLIISKGDANYRRLLGDRDWDFTLPFHQIVDYLPAPLAALRTLKAELAVGMDLDQIQYTYNQDPDWLVDGKWGVVHFAPGK
jgi:uncharacterized protein with ATP-grasp and redox domains